MNFFQRVSLVIFAILIPVVVCAGEKVRVLIIDGANNHDWQVTTDSLRSTLLASGIFAVDVSTAPEAKGLRSPRPTKDKSLQQDYVEFEKLKRELFKPSEDKLKDKWQDWNPEFSSYDTVLLNYNGRDWNEATRTAFINYINNGGGAVLVHAANNAFRNWPEFNDIIGMGWRPAPSGKAIKINDATGKPYWDKQAGNSSHGSKHPFQVKVRQADHPIMKGIPPVWMHGSDELYHDMRGPAENMTILSSAYSDPKQRGTGKHEPITWEVGYGKGKVIVTTMGHFWPGQDNKDSLNCVGFQTILARACEYVGSEQLILPDQMPENFPGVEKVSILAPELNTVTNQQAAQLAQEKKKADPYCTLSPGEQQTTFELAPGYTLELVASEPQVQEPVLTVWDGNGVMYVSEMRSYMQNVAGENTKEAKNSRIKRLEDTNGDGTYDRITTFADNLNLPRAILPLDDQIAVRETDSMDVICLRDTDGDGVADERTLLYQRGSYGRGAVGVSVEHQDSGLIWNIDNHIYISYNIERYRFTDGTWRAEKQRGHWTQWGLTHNDVGDLFWVTNTAPMTSPYLHPKYWGTASRLAGKGISGVPVDMGMPHTAEYLKSKSLCLLDDRGGPAKDVRGFTSACGQSVFRGNKLALDDYGRYFVVDPTIHVVRRSNMSKKDGLDWLEKTEPGMDEFLLSSDINCRFVNTATGPDGCLYITDMYRGIIQDAAWLSPGPRESIVKNGLDQNKQNGRIWRVRASDSSPGKMPNMLSESTVELVRHLENGNGWWRDTAQKLIILRDDREAVVPLLKGLVRFSNNGLARLHALWTLEGIGALEPEFVAEAYRDRDYRVRRAAIQISESWLDQESVVKALESLAQDRDGQVAQQLILSLGLVDDKPLAEEIIQTAARRHMKDKGVILASCVSLWGKNKLPLIKDINNNRVDPGDAIVWKNYLGNWSKGIDFPKDIDKDHRKLVESGEKIYFKSCVTCHGPDGKGIKFPGTDLMLAPSLVDSPRVDGDPGKLTSILLHGLSGPLDGKTYQAGFMAPAAALGVTREDRLAETLSYIRYAWGQKGGPITKDEVMAVREKFKSRTTPWTQAELDSTK